MRSANEQDVARAKATGKLEENVMYAWGFSHEDTQLVHGKKIGDLIPEIIADYHQFEGKQITICETADGVLHTCDIAAISPIVKKGPAQQPKKPRRKPMKGSKQETKIPMSSDVKLEVGDVVLLENGKRERVTVVDWGVGNGGYPYKTRYWCDAEGNVTFHKSLNIYEGESITHKIIPYQEPIKEEKSPEQEAFEVGYWVAHTTLPDSQAPSFVAENFVEVILACGDIVRTLSKRLCWSSDAGRTGAEVVAYRMAR